MVCDDELIQNNQNADYNVIVYYMPLTRKFRKTKRGGNGV